jgi:hypothetical protein
MTESPMRQHPPLRRSRPRPRADGADTERKPMTVVPQEINTVVIRLTAYNVQGKTRYGVWEDDEPHGGDDQDANSALAAVTSIAEGFIADTTAVRKRNP